MHHMVRFHCLGLFGKQCLQGKNSSRYQNKMVLHQKGERHLRSFTFKPFIVQRKVIIHAFRYT
uniref:Putative ovule protein n=1 Tax=Solanum chacoense TaxID=4108 RepID=A0A0V0GDX4_SOLCH